MKTSWGITNCDVLESEILWRISLGPSRLISVPQLAEGRRAYTIMKHCFGWNLHLGHGFAARCEAVALPRRLAAVNTGAPPLVRALPLAEKRVDKMRGGMARRNL